MATNPGLALVHSRACVGIHAPSVRVEVHLAGGLPQFNLVGLPGTAVREAKDRVRAAITCAGFEFPARRITVNLAPADLPKGGSRFDLPIALGILAAAGHLPRQPLGQYEFVGELALTGELRPVEGVLPAALAARSSGRRLVVAAGNAAECALVPDAGALVGRTLSAVCRAIRGVAPFVQVTETDGRMQSVAAPGATPRRLDLSDVCGQVAAKRALEIAAAGAHHLLLCGPPGCGKTLLASRLPGLLPACTEAEALEIAAVASVGRRPDPASWRQRPFRAPHHHATSVALIGGGANPRPGEISLAHHGVLFLDELPEWSAHALEGLREPLESGIAVISRAARIVEYPARFQLVAAMNPCPCGLAGTADGACRCTAEQVHHYIGRLSGPVLDRIDLQVRMERLAATELRPDAARGEDTAAVRERVERARHAQLARAGVPNARLDPHAMEATCGLGKADRALLEAAAERLALTARGLHRIQRVARTVADLDGAADIERTHLAEAISLRCGLGT